MNKHTRLVVSVLFVVIVIMAVGITRFYVNVSKNTGSSSNSDEIVRKLDIDDGGNRIFEDASGMYGIVDSRDRIIVDAEWLELSFADGKSCIASKRIGGRILMGCINYEGNITVPFIYRNIIKHHTDSFDFYIAESDYDGSCAVYDESFNPCFLQAWDEAEFEGSELILRRNSGTYTYNAGENGFACKKAVISGQAGLSEFTLNVYSRLLLSKLSAAELENISSAAGAYLEYAFSGESAALQKYTGGSLAAFSVIFPGEERITRKTLKDITDIYIYCEKSGTDAETYVISVTVAADISYTDNSGSNKKLSGKYKALIKFRRTSSGITAVSGSFAEAAPEYPQDTPEAPPDSFVPPPPQSQQ